MAGISTEITRLLNVKTPIIAAPMAGASGGALAAQVSLAGGFGFMQAGYDSEDRFRQELETARFALQGNGSDILTIGVGFIGWKLDEPDGKTAKLLSIALEAHVAAVWFAFGNDLGRWVSLVRKVDGARSKPHNTLVFVLVNSPEEARVATEEWQADVLVAQGIEAGGHGHGSALPLLALVPEILSLLKSAEQGSEQHRTRHPPVLAAGGLSTGAHIAALLTLGASGVALGTRFLLTPEARYTPGQKNELLAAHASSTVRTTALDVARGTLGWPAGVDGRALKNQLVRDVEGGLNVEEANRRYQKAVSEDDADRMIVWSGTGIGLVNEIKPASTSRISSENFTKKR